ncbi:MAG: hypothetical protein HS116_22525 [Planctomycetes bacterium]|nr:hypothetical protein [Planctomycetota bacterium]
MNGSEQKFGSGLISESVKSQNFLRALLAGIVLLGSAAAQDDSGPILFKAEGLKKGAVVRMDTQALLNLYGKEMKQIRRESLRTIAVLEDNGTAPVRIKVSYGEIRTQTNLSKVPSGKEPVSNKSYIVHEKEGKSEVFDLRGKPAPQEEADWVARDFPSLGQLNPISMTLHAQKLACGDEISGAESLHPMIEKRLSVLGVGRVEKFSARLLARHKFQGEETAIFLLTLQTGPSSLFQDAKMRLTGQLVVSVPSGRPIALKFDGPVQVNLGSSENDSTPVQGTLTLTAITQTELPESQTPPKTTSDDDDLLIVPGTGLRVGRRLR